ncbi:hypothetical protein Tco_0861239 [Tanacetum coccineum]|uniref:Uncharacterized protein n=1 Tax=Tanacetum coccineum TaxID=301880 RepID=A0ABQ5BK67_9ASTR
MVVLESCPKHNMVAYLEKTDGNAEFHEIIDFLARSSIHNAFTISPVVSTTFLEQFWMSAKSKIINNVRYITAKVAGKPVFISKASIRSDLLFDDADGIDYFLNQAIFDAIQLIVFLDTQLKSVPVPLDHFPVNSLTSKVSSFMVKKGKHFSGKATPLFSNMLVQPTEDEESSGRNHEDQAKEIKHLKAQIKKLKKKAKPVITHHRAWIKSVSLKQRLVGKKSLKKQWMQKESVSKQGRKPAKAEPLVHKDPLFDELADDTLDYMDTENAQDMERLRFVVHEEKEREEKEVSTKDVVSTNKEKVSTDRSKVSTDRSRVSTDKEEVSTDRLDEGTNDQTEGRSATPTTQTPTPTTFGDDETIAQVLLNISQVKAVSREKEKGVELKDVEETERSRPTSTKSLLTLKPLPKIDPKDKGKKKIEEEDESDTESEGIPEAENKFKQLARDEEMARKMQEDWEKEEERKRLAKEEAINAALIQDFDDIKVRMEADRLLALRLQEEERALRNQMMTYLKHAGNKKHSDLKNKTFEEIQALYEKVKRFDESFTAVGSTEDERKIKEMNEGAKDLEQKRLKKKVTKETPKKEDTTQMIARKRKRPQSDVDSDDEHIKCLNIVTFEGIIDSEIMEIKSVIARLNKVSSPDGDYLVIYRANGNFRAFNCLLEGDLKIMIESSTEENDQNDFWNDQQDWVIVTWRLYKACRVYILELKDGTVIHMLVERRVFNSPCFMVKSWLVQDQTVLGKDYSNLLIADSLLKTIWFINAPCYGNEALASPKANELTIPEQTATGKGKSNMFMAGSLPKTTKPT